MLTSIRFMLPLVSLCLFMCSSPNQEVEQSAKGFTRDDLAGKTFALALRAADSPMAGKSVSIQFGQDSIGQLRAAQEGQPKQEEMLIWWVSNDSLSLWLGEGLYMIKGKIKREGKGFVIKQKGSELLLTP